MAPPLVLMVLGIPLHLILHREMSPHYHHVGLLVKLVKIAVLPIFCQFSVLERKLVSQLAHHRKCFLGLGRAVSFCFSTDPVPT